MKSLIGVVVGIMVASFGVGLVGFQPAMSVWAGQGTEHDHTLGADASAPPGATQSPALPSAQDMSKMRQDMMARMSTLDSQAKGLATEMNNAKSVDAKLAAITKLLNVMVEQRSMMQMQTDMQGKMMEQMMSMHQMMMQHAQPGASKP